MAGALDAEICAIAAGNETSLVSLGVVGSAKTRASTSGAEYSGAATLGAAVGGSSCSYMVDALATELFAIAARAETCSLDFVSSVAGSPIDDVLMTPTGPLMSPSGRLA